MQVQKILFVSIFKEGEGGGEGRVAYEMARWFSNHYQVVMLCPGETTGLQVDSSHFKRFLVESTGQGNLSVPLLSGANVRKINNFLDEFKPDILHIHDPALLGVVGQLWARFNQVPVVYTAHILPSRALDFGANEAAHILSGSINEALVEGYLLNFYQNCDAVVGLNETAAAEIREFGYGGTILLIPNGRNLSLYHYCRLADLSAGNINLTFVGFISKRKNQIYLLDVMRFLPPNFQLTLVGEALSPAYLDELKQIVEENHIWVTFTGQLDQKEIAATLEKTHVFVSASKMEVQSLVIIEALASGTPVVGLSNETVDELVDESDGICLSKDASPDAFAAAIQSVCSLPPGEYTALCEQARERVKDLDWSNVMEKTVRQYELILDSRVDAPLVLPAHDLWFKFTSQIPVGRLRDDILEVISNLTMPVIHKPAVNVSGLWITLLNMSGSMFAYYALKGTSLALRPFRKKKTP